jgi:Na+/melibiose symporter-like transporter
MEQTATLPLATKTLPPVRIDIAFSLIMLGTTIAWSVNDGWLLYFYLPPKGQGVALVPLAFYGIVILIARIVNAIVTPPIGYWSDNLQSKWGRRIPFMVTASLPLVITFFLLWVPPVQDESMTNLIYLGVILVLFNIAQNLVIIPLGSLLPELAEIDRHRVRLTAWSASFQLIGVVLAGTAGLLIGHFGYVSMALIFAAVILPFLYLPFLVLREKPGRQIEAAQRMGFFQSIRVTITNRAFLMLTAAGICFWTAIHPLYRDRNLPTGHLHHNLFLFGGSFTLAGLLSARQLAIRSLRQMEDIFRFSAGIRNCLAWIDVDRSLVTYPVVGAGFDLDRHAGCCHVWHNHAATGLCRRDHRL